MWRPHKTFASLPSIEPEAGLQIDATKRLAVADGEAGSMCEVSPGQAGVPEYFEDYLRERLADEATLAALVSAFRAVVGPEAEPGVSNPYLVRLALLQGLLGGRRAA